MRRIKNASAHHIMTARFKHQTLPDPVIVLKKILSLLTHVVTLQHRAAACHQANRVTTCMRVDAEKSFFSQSGCFETLAVTTVSIIEKGFLNDQAVTDKAR